MKKARIVLLLALTLLAGVGGAALAQLRGEDACLDAGGRVIGAHSTCVNAAGEEWPLRAPYASYTSLACLGVFTIAALRPIRRARRLARRVSRPMA